MKQSLKALFCALILSALPAGLALAAGNSDLDYESAKVLTTHSNEAGDPGQAPVNQNLGTPVIVWNNFLISTYLILASQYDAITGMNVIVADDFIFDEATEVNGVVWYGGYFEPVDPNYDWEVIFYYDDGTGTKPGDIYAPFFFSNADLSEDSLINNGYEYLFTYTAALPEIISFDAGTKYWVSIQGVGVGPPQCGVNIHQILREEPLVFRDPNSEPIPYNDWTSSVDVWFLEEPLSLSYQLTYTKPCVWNPGDWVMMENAQLPNDTGWTVNATEPIVLADDWLSIQTAPIKDIHWWGAWENGIEGDILYFNLSIHEDIPAGQSQTGYSMPGDILWERQIDAFEVVEINPPEPEHWYNPATGYIEANDHLTYYQYNVCFDDPLDWFSQAEGVIYWLNISAVVADPQNTQWGWKSTADHWNDDAVWFNQVDWIEMYEPGPFVYIPGDVNDDGAVNNVDVEYLSNYYFGAGPPPPYSVPGTSPPFYAAADVNEDCQIGIGDITYLDAYVNASGPPPLFCPAFPPNEDPVSLDLAFVITGDPPTGACCYEDGSCEVLEPFNCDAAGGSYRGNNTICLGDTNPPDGIDDLCAWICGDVNGTETVNLLDITYLIAYLYMDGDPPEFMQSADVNSTGTVNLLDITYLISFLYMDGPAPNCP